MADCPTTSSTTTLNASTSSTTSLNPGSSTSSTSSSTTQAGGSLVRFQQLLADSGVVDNRARLIYNSTKEAFEHKIVLLRRRKASYETKIEMLEDFSIYRTGRSYDPVAWTNKRIALEVKLQETIDSLALVLALYNDYFGGNGSTSSSTTQAPGSSTSSSTTQAPGTSSSSTTMAPGTSSSSTTAAPGSVTFTAVLNGSKEVPPVSTAATGNASLVYNPATKVFVLNVTFTGLTPISAHIHKGAAGVDGDIVFGISDLTSPMVATSTPLTAAQEADLYAGLYYVNIHTTANPDGEIRGNLVR